MVKYTVLVTHTRAYNQEIRFIKEINFSSKIDTAHFVYGSSKRIIFAIENIIDTSRSGNFFTDINIFFIVDIDFSGHTPRSGMRGLAGIGSVNFGSFRRSHTKPIDMRIGAPRNKQGEQNANCDRNRLSVLHAYKIRKPPELVKWHTVFFRKRFAKSRNKTMQSSCTKTLFDIV